MRRHFEFKPDMRESVFILDIGAFDKSYLLKTNHINEDSL